MKIGLVDNSIIDTISVVELSTYDLLFVHSGIRIALFIVPDSVKDSASPLDDLKLLITSERHFLDFEPQTSIETLFDFTGVEKRKGDATKLKLIDLSFKNEVLHNFIENCMDILIYQKDQWDAQNISSLLTLKPSFSFSLKSSVKNQSNSVHNPEPSVTKVVTSVKKATISKASVAESYVFYRYLPAKLQEEWVNLEKQGKSDREIFLALMNQFKEEYRKAQRTFTMANPDLSIYTREAQKKESKSKSVKKDTFARCDGFDFLYKRLEERGYKQISDIEWKNKLGETYVIDIHPSELSNEVVSDYEDDDYSEHIQIPEPKVIAEEEPVEEEITVLQPIKPYLENNHTEDKFSERKLSEADFRFDYIDTFRIDKTLTHAFDRTTASYKYWWFISILDLFKKDRVLTISFQDIFIRMMVNAWSYDSTDLKLGSNDYLKNHIKTAKRVLDLTESSTPEVITSELKKYAYIDSIKAIFVALSKYVPVNFLTPWKDAGTEPPYKINGDSITLNGPWIKEIFKHYDLLRLWIKTKLSEYLEKCNKGVTNFSLISQNLVSSKKPIQRMDINWSFLEYGFNITVDNQSVLSEVTGNKYTPGAKYPICLKIGKCLFHAQISCADLEKSKYGAHSPVIQVMYSSNSGIQDELRYSYSALYKFLYDLKNGDFSGKKAVTIPDHLKAIIDFTYNGNGVYEIIPVAKSDLPIVNVENEVPVAAESAGAILPENYGNKWTAHEQNSLKHLYVDEKKSIDELSIIFKRTKGSIISKLKAFGVLRIEDDNVVEYQLNRLSDITLKPGDPNKLIMLLSIFEVVSTDDRTEDYLYSYTQLKSPFKENWDKYIHNKYDEVFNPSEAFDDLFGESFFEESGDIAKIKVKDSFAKYLKIDYSREKILDKVKEIIKTY